MHSKYSNLLCGAALALPCLVSTATAQEIDIHQVSPIDVAHDNQAVLSQTGKGNTAGVEQEAIASGLAPGSNSAAIIQNGDRNSAGVTQYGQHDSAIVGQYGSNLKTEVTQTGSNLGVSVNQYGVGNGSTVTVTQTGPGAPIVSSKP